MSKILLVATEVQAAVFTQVLLDEISSGFWKDVRPADHASSWKGVNVQVQTTEGGVLGATGFTVPRNYNLVNPEFLAKSEAEMLEVALTVDANMTIKKLRKQLIELSRIVGGRITSIGGTITKANRGQHKKAETPVGSVTTKAKASVRKVPATFVEAGEKEAA